MSLAYYGIVLGVIIVGSIGALWYIYYLRNSSTQSSILPDVPVNERENSFCIIDHSSFILDTLWNLGLGLLFVGVAVGMGYLYFFGYVKSNFTMAAALGSVVLFLFWFAWKAFQGAYAEFVTGLNIQEGKLLIDSWPLYLGEEFDLTWRRNVPENFELFDASFELKCTVVAEYGSKYLGSDFRSRYRRYEQTLYSQSLDVDSSDFDQPPYELQRTVKIPDDLEQSLNIYSHEISWELDVTLQCKGLPDELSSYDLLVLPKSDQ